MQMLYDGHIKVYQNLVDHAQEDGAAKVTIDYTIKNIAHEAAAQLTRQLRSQDITPDQIALVNDTTGGDHGVGIFIAGSQIVATLFHSISTNTGDQKELFSFEISVAEIIC